MTYAVACFLAMVVSYHSVGAASTGPTSAPRESQGAAASIVDLPDQLGLASADTLLTFDRRTGDVADIVHRPTGRQFASPNRGPLFAIMLVEPATTQRGTPEASGAVNAPRDTEEIRVDAHSFRRVSIEKDGSRQLALTFREHPKYDLSVTVTAKADDDGAIRLRLNVRNGTKMAIRRVPFPHMPWSPQLGEDISDDRLLIPFHDGQLISAPGRTNGVEQADYPGLAAVQFAAYYDRQAGVYLAAEDAGGHPKRWQRDTVARKHVAVNLLHLFEESPGNDVAIDYDVVLRTFVGDWRDAAAIYKAWVVKQPWCARKLTDRADVPAFLKEGAGVIIEAGFQNADSTAERFGKDLEKLPEFVQAYRRKTGLAHIVFVPYGWENRGTWAGINYFPARPSDEAWVQTARRLRQDGNRLMFMPSGFWWVVKRQEVGDGPAFDDSAQIKQYEPMLVKNPDGTPWSLDCYDITKRPRQTWRGLSMHLCHGSPEAQEKMKDIFLHAARLGVSLVSFDQEQGATQQAPCYDVSHKHGRGFGSYIWIGFRKTCEMILAEGKSINPDLCLSLEDTCELAIPCMATYWSRQFKGGFDETAFTPNTYPNSVGLFSYLYHEYTTAIGAACVQGQGDKATVPPAELRCFILSNNLCRGLIPGPFARDVPLDPKDEWHQAVSRAFFSYCQPYARFPEYLVLGESIRPPKVNCVFTRIPVDTGATSRPTTRPAKQAGPEVRFPAVNAGSFRAADGSVATVLANTTDAPQSARVVFSSRSATLTLYDAHRQELRQWTEVPVGQEIALDLEPFGVRVLISR